MQMNFHNHAEAFMLMRYESDDSRVVEYLWNSRDGVTPFCIVAKDGKTELRHTQWKRDEYRPSHRPMPGDRIFAAITPQSAAKYAAARMKAFDGTEYELQGEDREAMEKRLVESFLADDCPDVVTVETPTAEPPAAKTPEP
jgi:hypothetical protein